MSLKKFEEFEHNLEESDKLEHMRDFKAATAEIFPESSGQAKVHYFKPQEGIVLINHGSGTPFVAVKVLGFVQSLEDIKKLA